MRFRRSLLTVAAVHATGPAVHACAHASTGIENAVWEQLFIVIVVTIKPWVSVVVAWKYGIAKGALLLALSMFAAFLFGYVLHFVADGPDMYANVGRPNGLLYFHSAAGLSLVEFAGAALGLYVLMRARRRSCRVWRERDRSGEHKRRGTNR